MGWLYVPGLAGLSSDLNSLSETPTIACVSLNGILSPRPLSWRGWRNRSWIRLLFGTTWKPSILNLGAVEWISCQPVSPASRSPMPASGELNKTSGGFGLPSPQPFATWDPGSSSWRTSQVSLLPDLETFSATWPRSGSMRWPTTNTRDGSSAARHTTKTGVMHPGTTLTDAIRLWATPATDRSDELLLKGQAKRWATPQARDWKSETTEFRQEHFPTLGRQVRQRETPSLPAQETTTGGDPRLLSTPRLNPRFVEWLMGFPIGWTDFEPLGTEWSHWWPLMRSRFLRLGWRSYD